MWSKWFSDFLRRTCFCRPDVEAGRYLLDEIMRSGNFGKYDTRLQRAHSGGNVRLYLHNVGRLMNMIRFYPSEVLWAPLWKVGHWMWRRAKGEGILGCVRET